VHLALCKGLNLAISLLVLPIEDILDGVENAICTLLEEGAEEIQHETVRILKQSKKLKSHLSKAKIQALHLLQGNANLMVLSANKGNAMVVLNTTDYVGKISHLQDGWPRTPHGPWCRKPNCCSGVFHH
jgi:hypothetical protein